jgi:hypothetical protein
MSPVTVDACARAPHGGPGDLRGTAAHGGHDARRGPTRGAPDDAPPPLLHNVGWAPRASIVWRGLGRGPVTGEADRLQAARTHGAWLNLSATVGRADPRWQRQWNTAAAVLSVLEPGHALDETAAARRLLERIDAHARRLDWPPWLLAAPADPRGGTRHEPGVTLDHVETVFVALAHSTGSLWLRTRAPRLAPLHAPWVDPPGQRGRQAAWRAALWFPDGLPAPLLTAVGAPARGETASPTDASAT